MRSWTQHFRGALSPGFGFFILFLIFLVIGLWQAANKGNRSSFARTPTDWSTKHTHSHGIQIRKEAASEDNFYPFVQETDRERERETRKNWLLLMRRPYRPSSHCLYLSLSTVFCLFVRMHCVHAWE